MNSKQIWGKVLTRLREINEAALFVSCGEIENVKILEDTFIIQTEKKYLADIIQMDQNLLALKRAFRFVGHDFDVKIEILPSKNLNYDKDIEFLKQKLGKFLKLD